MLCLFAIIFKPFLQYLNQNLRLFCGIDNHIITFFFDNATITVLFQDPHMALLVQERFSSTDQLLVILICFTLFRIYLLKVVRLIILFVVISLKIFIIVSL